MSHVKKQHGLLQNERLMYLSEGDSAFGMIRILTTVPAVLSMTMGLAATESQALQTNQIKMPALTANR